MKAYKTNIETQTLDNENYRKVLFTGEKLQLVVMSIKPQEDINLETHDHIDQFIRVESGEAYVKVNEEEYNLEDDDVIIIPAGTQHYVKNKSQDKTLKIYSIYADPEHDDGTIHKTKKDSDEDHHHH